MHKFLFFSLIITFFTACSELKLPDLPKIQKNSEPTKAECAKIVRAWRERNDVSTSEAYRKLELDANWCEKKYTYSPSTEDMMKNIDKLGK